MDTGNNNPDLSYAYSGTFDGLGHAITNFSRTVTSGNYGGLFNFVSAATIKNFCISGSMTISYTGLGMGTIAGLGWHADSSNSTFEDIHSSVNMTVTGSNTPAQVGGLVGRMSGTINRCRYSGTMTLNNAANQVAGICGSPKGKFTCKNTLFDGSLTTTSTSTSNSNFRLGGIFGGHDNGGNFTVSNCLVDATISIPSTAPTAETDRVGIVFGIADLTGSLTVSVTDTYYTTDKVTKGGVAFTLAHGKITSDSSRTTYNAAATTTDALVNGETCALLNASNGEWSQILGYQTLGYRTDGSPAMARPVPANPTASNYYPVTKDGSAYTIGYYYLDDNGDTTPMPSDATSVKAKKISYTRSASYMRGYISMCLPFAFTEEMKAAQSTKCYAFSAVDGDVVRFSEITTFPIPAGTPFIMYDTSNADWTPNLSDANGIALATSVNNPQNGALGINGQFATTTINAGWYKLNADGDALGATAADAVCYPYRVYLKLTSDSNARAFVPFFDEDDDDETNVDEVKMSFTDADGATKVYNLNGQRVSANYKRKGGKPSIVIVNGKKVIL